MSSFILYRKDGLIQGSSGASVDTTNLLTKVAAATIYVDESGDQMRGGLDMNGFRITNLPAAVNPNDAVRKADVLTTTGTVFQSDVNMNGFKIINYGTASEDTNVVNKVYVDGKVTAYVNANALSKNTDLYLNNSKIYYSLTADAAKQLIDVTYANANYVKAPLGVISNNLFLSGAKIYSGSVVDETKELVDKEYIDDNFLGIDIHPNGIKFVQLGDILMMTGTTTATFSPLASKAYVDSVAYSQTAADGRYLKLTGGILAGELSMNNLAKIVNLKDPEVNQDAATKIYVDSRVNMGTSISNPYTTDIYIQDPKRLFNYTPATTSTGAITNAILDIVALRNIFLAQSGGTLTGDLILGLGKELKYLINTGATPIYDYPLTLSGISAMTGNLDLGVHKIINLLDPTNPQDAATRAYVDSRVNQLNSGGTGGSNLPLTGGTLTGDLIMDMGREIKYLLSNVNSIPTYDLPIRASGAHAMTGNLNLNTNKIIGVKDPELDQDAATKAYADTKLARQGGTIIGNTFMANGAHIFNSLTPDATKALVDKSQVLLTTGGTLSGRLLVQGANAYVVNKYSDGSESNMLDVATGDGRYINKTNPTGQILTSDLRLVGNLQLDTNKHIYFNDTYAETILTDGSKPMAGLLAMGSNRITGLGDPANDQDAVTRKYLTTYYYPKTGGTINGSLTLTGTLNMGSNRITDLSDPRDLQDAVTSNYVKNNYLSITGGNMGGNINLGNMYKITNVPTPTDNGDAASKSYVDNKVPASFLFKTAGHYYGTPAGSIPQGRIKNIEDPTEQQDVVTKQHLDYSARTTVINMANYAIKNLGFDGSTSSAMSYGMFLSFSINKYIHYKMSYRQIIANPSLWISGSFPDQFDLATDYYTDVRLVNAYNFANANTNLTRVGLLYRIKETINGTDYYYLSFDGSQQLTSNYSLTDFDVTQVDSRTVTFAGTATVKSGYTVIYICRKNVVPTNGIGRTVGSLQNNCPVGFWNNFGDVAYINENINGVDTAERTTPTTSMHCYILRVSSAGVCDFWDFNRVIKLNKTITNPAFGTLALGRDGWPSEAGPFYLYELWMWKTNLSDLQLNQVRRFISVHYPFA